MNIITIKKISDYNISAADLPKQNCCCNNELKELKSSIEKSQQQILTQLLLSNSNQIKVCNYLESMDKKINKILESDKKTRSSAMPLPKIPAPFLGLLPIRTDNSLEIVEELLSSNHIHSLTNKEELVLIYILKHYIRVTQHFFL